MNPRFHDIGAYIKGVKALTPNVVLTSVGGGIEQNGDDIDREGQNRLYLSTKLMVPYAAIGLTAGATATLKLTVQDGVTSTAYSDFADETGTTAFSVIASSAAPSGVLEASVDLAKARRFLRCQLLPIFSAGTGDTVALGVVWAFGGGEENPAA